ncbi:MAG: dihydropteroate synthase [Arcobacteraceae bacterium]|nr:dihydropteroate synthase [Arcobacteraceae bacterium]
MEFYKLDNSCDIQNTLKLFQSIGSDETGCKIISKKTKSHLLYIKNIHVGGANILKQDALSIGADLLVPMGVIVAREKYVNVILVGTTKHFEILSRKELAQPFGLKELAKELQSFVNTKIYSTKIMGIINANDDSFFEESRFKGSDAIDKIETMINDGADIIDIGGVSTRPGSDAVDEKEELVRIQPICDLIKEKKLYEKTVFSIDSYTPRVIEYALKSGFTIVNDITGLVNDEVAKITAKYGATIVIMHMQGTPKDMQHNPIYEDVMCEVDSFFKERIQKAKEFGIEKIILDVGIGFGKTLEHNLILLKNMEHFRHFGYEVLIGASRKSLIEKVIPNTPTSQRLPATLTIHLDSVRKGASIVRCHDVKEHSDAIKMQESIDKSI